jgi:hypothetical protein
MSNEKLFAAVLGLPPKDRARLAHQLLSAVLFCRNHVRNAPALHGLPAGRDWVVIHNPYAEVPLPFHAIGRGHVWWRDGAIVHHRDWHAGNIPLRARAEGWRIAADF